MSGKSSGLLAVVAVFLSVSIVAGGVILWSRLPREEPIEISNQRPQQWQGRVYVGGAVNNPGIYPLQAGDSIDSLLRAAGGPNTGGDLTVLELLVRFEDERVEAQKVNINQADAWLLIALPGIGETLAKRIIDYREQNGPFRSTDELLKVPGIGDSVYARINRLVSVADR
jgi:competence protein ComEA